MIIYVVLHYGEVEKAFKNSKDALNYVLDGEDVDDIPISNVGPMTDGEWTIETCYLE